ncbi:MAG: universal stress protein, partial [Ginsengibacter sp.]
MKTILAPIDFSDASFSSADYAASLANIFNAELILVHAYINPSTIDEMPRELFTVPETELDEVL